MAKNIDRMEFLKVFEALVDSSISVALMTDEEVNKSHPGTKAFRQDCRGYLEDYVQRVAIHEISKEEAKIVRKIQAAIKEWNGGKNGKG